MKIGLSVFDNTSLPREQSQHRLLASFLAAFLFVFILSFVNESTSAELYLGISPSSVKIDASSSAVKHQALTASIGYSYQPHHLEFQYTGGSGDEHIHALSSNSLTISSLFYLYDFNLVSDFKIYFMFGASSSEIKLQYLGSASINETFKGNSYGLILEDTFDSLPDLKLRLNLIKLYQGDALDISSMQLGLKYVF